MGKKIKIRENQLNHIINYVNENEQIHNIIKTIVDDVRNNYEPALGTFDNGSDYSLTNIITNKISGEEISPKALFNYLTNKYTKVNDELIKQIIDDWYSGNLSKDYKLSKNVRFN